VSGASDVSPAERTDLAWQRTGLGLLSVSGLLGARALHGRAPALLVVAGVAALIGLAVLGVLAPLRVRQLQRRRAAREDVSAPRVIVSATLAVVAVAVAAGVGVLTAR
jgi:putative membrane protein